MSTVPGRCSRSHVNAFVSGHVRGVLTTSSPRKGSLRSGHRPKFGVAPQLCAGRTGAALAESGRAAGGGWTCRWSQAPGGKGTPDRLTCIRSG
jgi:hypothetical protein